MSERTTSDVVQLVRRYLADVRLDDDIYLEVDEPHIRQGDKLVARACAAFPVGPSECSNITRCWPSRGGDRRKGKGDVLFSTGEPLTEADEEQAEPAVAA
jgi:hypothetical protein